MAKVKELPCDVFERQCAEVSDYLESQGLGTLAEALKGRTRTERRSH